MTRDEMNEIMRHFDVVAEGLGGKITMVAEGISALNTKADGLEVQMDRVDARLDTLEMKVDALTEETRANTARLDTLEVKVDTLAAETRANHDELRASIKFSYAEIDRRMTHLESSVADLASRVLRLEEHSR